MGTQTNRRTSEEHLGTQDTRILKHLSHSDTRWALRYSGTQGTLVFGQLETRALRHLVHSDICLLETLETPYLADSCEFKHGNCSNVKICLHVHNLPTDAES